MKFFSIQLSASALAVAALLSACGGGGNTSGTGSTAVSGSTGTCTAAPCINFAETTLGMVDFGFLGIEVANDPADATNKVAKLTKATDDETWAGVTVHLGGTGNTVTRIDPALGITLRVYSPAAGKTIMVKIEDAAANGVEATATSTKAGEWETLTFTYSSANAATTYNKVSVFPGFGTKFNEVYYIDELKYTAKAADVTTVASFSSLTYDEATAPTLTPFGVNTAPPEIVTDPSGGTNKVLKVYKVLGSEQWAGVTVSTAASQAVATIPFTATAKTMTLRVYSPAVGVRVRLKVENAGDNTISCETDAITTSAGAWETLTFNFANPGTSPPVGGGATAALNLTKTYNKVSIFSDFGLGAGGYAALPENRIYYFDTLTFVP